MYDDFPLQENLAKKRGGQGKQSKMPELSETSETESVKGSGGSMDSETETSSEKQNGDMVAAPAPDKAQVAFPSLPPSFLRKLGLEAKAGETPIR